MSDRHTTYGDDGPAYGDEGPAFSDHGPGQDDGIVYDASAYGEPELVEPEVVEASIYDFEGDAYGDDDTIYVDDSVAFDTAVGGYWADDVAYGDAVPEEPVARTYTVAASDDVVYGDHGPDGYTPPSTSARAPYAQPSAQGVRGATAAPPRPPQQGRRAAAPQPPPSSPQGEGPPKRKPLSPKARFERFRRSPAFRLLGGLVLLGAVCAAGYALYPAPAPGTTATSPLTGLLAKIPYLSHQDTPVQIAALEDDLVLVRRAIVAYVVDNDELPKSAKELSAQMKKMEIKPQNPFMRLGGDSTLVDGTEPKEAGTLYYMGTGKSYQLRAADGNGKSLHLNGAELVMSETLETLRDEAAAARGDKAASDATGDDAASPADDPDARPLHKAADDGDASGEATPAGHKHKRHTDGEGDTAASKDGDATQAQGTDGKSHKKKHHKKKGQPDAAEDTGPARPREVPSPWSPSAIWASITEKIPFLSQKESAVHIAQLEDNLVIVQRAVDRYVQKNGSLPKSAKALASEMKEGSEPLNPYGKTTNLDDGTEPSGPGAIAYKATGDKYQLRIGDAKGKTLTINGVDLVIDTLPAAKGFDSAEGKDGDDSDDADDTSDDKDGKGKPKGKQGKDEDDDAASPKPGKHGEDDPATPTKHHKGLTDIPEASPLPDDTSKAGRHKRHGKGDPTNLDGLVPSAEPSAGLSFKEIKRLRNHEFWNSTYTDPTEMATPTPAPTPLVPPSPPESLELRLRHNHEFDLWRMRGISRLYSGHTATALEAFNKALVLRPGDPSVTKWVDVINAAIEKDRAETRDKLDRNRQSDTQNADTRRAAGDGSTSRTGRAPGSPGRVAPPPEPPAPPANPAPERTPTGVIDRVRGRTGRAATTDTTQMLDDLKKADKAPVLSPPKLDP